MMKSRDEQYVAAKKLENFEEFRGMVLGRSEKIWFGLSVP